MIKVIGNVFPELADLRYLQVILMKLINRYSYFVSILGFLRWRYPEWPLILWTINSTQLSLPLNFWYLFSAYWKSFPFSFEHLNIVL